MSKILPNRRQRKPPGSPIKVSKEVREFMDKRRTARGQKLSHDALLRQVFGLSSRKGAPSPLLTGWLEVDTEQFFLNKQDALSAAVMSAAQRKVKKVTQPIQVRSVI